MAGPLAGVRVVELPNIGPVQFAGMLLADLGATVIKVESPAGDETRTWRPPEKDGTSTYYLSINRNKRSICLDLKSAEGKKAALELINRADVLVACGAHAAEIIGGAQAPRAAAEPVATTGDNDCGTVGADHRHRRSSGSGAGDATDRLPPHCAPGGVGTRERG